MPGPAPASCFVALRIFELLLPLELRPVTEHRRMLAGPLATPLCGCAAVVVIVDVIGLLIVWLVVHLELINFEDVVEPHSLFTVEVAEEVTTGV